MSISKQTCASMVLQANPALSEKEAASLVDDMIRDRDLLAAQEKLTRGSADLAEAVNRRFDDEQRALAAKRRQAAITILRRRDFDDYAAQVRSEGFSALDALEARLVGHLKRFTGARQSADARQQGIRAEWLGSMAQELRNIADGLGMSFKAFLKMVNRNSNFHDNFARERMKPGSTRDKAAQRFAEFYGRLSEAIRLRLNEAGADIGHLEGRLPQSHDPDKLLSIQNGGRQGWVNFTFGLLDMERTFPGVDATEARAILGRIYDTIATGKDLNTGDAPAVRTTRNLASGFGRHRVLHFKDADSFLKYNGKYGRNGLLDAVYGEIEQGARMAGLMEIFGPNPEHMIRSILQTEAERLRAAVDAGAMDAALGQKQIENLNKAWGKGIITSGQVARWFAVLSGETQRVDSVGLAKAFGIARSVQMLGKLGGASLSAIADGMTKTMSMRTNGANFLEYTIKPLTDLLARYRGDKRRLLHELGFVADSTLGSMMHRFDMADSVPGKMASLAHGFFKYSGLNFMTEQSKAGYAMWLSRYLGGQHRKGFDALSPEIRALLEYHGFGADRWEVFRKHMVEVDGENRYFNPALARELDDEAIEHLLPEHLAHPERHLTPKQNAVRGLESMNRVIEMQEDVLNAMYRPEVGGISFYWGIPGKGPRFKGGSGIAHIIAKRNAEGQDGEVVVRKMIDVLAYGKMGPEYGPPGWKRRNVSYDGHTAVLSLYRWEGRETWLFTGWQDNELAPNQQAEVHVSDLPTSQGPTLNRPEAAGATDESIPSLGVNGKSLFNAITPAQWNLARKRELDRIRTDLETQARAFLIDDTRFAVIEPDARTTATMTQGRMRGTLDGELIRAVMQFKSFPIAFLSRMLGGRRWRRGGRDLDPRGLAEYIAFSIAYGYIAMTLKDLSKNRTPKDPRKPETWFAAMVQSGGAGIYGDFFLGKMNRFGNDFLSTLAGPLPQELVGAVTTANLALHGEGEAARDRVIRTAMNNMPFINLWYTRATLDWAIFDGVKEWMSPGYKRRMLRNMRQEFGQSPIVR